MHTASEIAKWIIASTDHESGDTISPLKLQKLLYYCQAWTLALLDRELFPEDFKAWAHGPVVPAVYHEYKQYRWEAIPREAGAGAPKLDPETEDILGQVMEIYGQLGAKRLEYLTHHEKPWLEARRGCAPEEESSVPISKKTMKRYYRKLAKKTAA